MTFYTYPDGDERVHERERLHHLPHGAALQFMVEAREVPLTKKQRLVARRIAKNLSKRGRMPGLWWWLPRRPLRMFGIDRSVSPTRLAGMTA